MRAAARKLRNLCRSSEPAGGSAWYARYIFITIGGRPWLSSAWRIRPMCSRTASSGWRGCFGRHSESASMLVWHGCPACSSSTESRVRSRGLNWAWTPLSPVTVTGPSTCRSIVRFLPHVPAQVSIRRQPRTGVRPARSCGRLRGARHQRLRSRTARNGPERGMPSLPPGMPPSSSGKTAIAAVRAIAISHLGGALTGIGQYPEGAAAYDKAAAIFREVVDQRGESRVLTGLVDALRLGGRGLEQAIDLNRRSAKSMKQAGDYHVRESAHHWLTYRA
jgi:hypothetical protein